MLQFLKQTALKRLLENIGSNTAHYGNGCASDLLDADDVITSRVPANGPPLLVDQAGAALGDLAATKAIHDWLGHLTPVQAAEPRLWTYLCHGPYSAYVNERWGDGIRNAKDPAVVIKTRYFFQGTGSAVFVRNAISRLWWFGRLTYEGNKPDPFRLTQALVWRQDVQQAFLERSIGRSLPVLRASLEAILTFQPEIEQMGNPGMVVKRFAKQIRAHGGAYILDALPQDRLKFVIESKLRNILGMPEMDFDDDDEDIGDT